MSSRPRSPILGSWSLVFRVLPEHAVRCFTMKQPPPSLTPKRTPPTPRTSHPALCSPLPIPIDHECRPYMGALFPSQNTISISSQACQHVAALSVLPSPELSMCSVAQCPLSLWKPQQLPSGSHAVPPLAGHCAAKRPRIAAMPLRERPAMWTPQPNPPPFASDGG